MSLEFNAGIVLCLTRTVVDAVHMAVIYLACSCIRTRINSTIIEYIFVK